MRPLPALLLLAAGGSATLIRSSTSGDSEATSYTTPWADTSRVGDTTFYSRGRVITTVTVHADSHWTARPSLPEITPAPLGIPFGPFDIPLDSLCTLGYTGTTLAVDAPTVVRDLQKIRDCGARAFAKIRRVKLKDSAGNLSVAAAKSELETWPWLQLCGRVRDSTIIAFYIGDDVGADDWGPAPLKTRFAQWDTIAGLVQTRCPGAPVAIRSRPTQLEARPNWQWLTTAWAQYPGPRPGLGTPEQFFAADVAAAKRLRLGLVSGVNLLDGGCGPVTQGRCLPDLPGTSAPGARSDRYQVSAAELVYYKTVAMSDPYICASVDWVWGPNVKSDFHNKAENRSALKALGMLAQTRPRTSCTVRN